MLFKVLNHNMVRVFNETYFSCQTKGSTLTGFLSCVGFTELPLLSSEIHCGYEDIHHSCLKVFQVFQGERSKRTLQGLFFFFKSF